MSDFATIVLGAATAVNSFALAALLGKLRNGHTGVIVGVKAPELTPRVSDHFSRFLAECTEVAPGNRVRMIDLYEAFIVWNGMSGAVRWSLRAFSSAMYDAGFGKYVQSGIWCDGVRLKEVAQ